jgi:hypothetical protein
MRDLLPVLRWPLLRPLAWLALLLPAMAGAQQPAAADPAPAAVPQAPHAPLAYTPMQPQPGADTTLAEWRTAHQAVAAFPRGHADIVRWEATQGNAPAVAAPTSHHQHGGHKP